MPMLLFILSLFATTFINAQASDGLSNVSYPSVIALDKGKPDHVIAYGDDPLQFGELWLAKKSSQQNKAPLVVFIHGGCWLNAYDIAHTHALSTAIKQAGFAVWSLEYRRTGDEGGGWPGTFNDVVQGVLFTEKLSMYPIDLSRIVVVGHSAGGHLALLAAASPGIKDKVKGVVGLAAISDLITYASGTNSCQKAAVSFMGGGIDTRREDYVKADPRQHGLHANTVLIHGDKDKIVSLTQSSKSNLPFVPVNGAGHFDMIHPGTQSWKILMNTLTKVINK